MDHQRHKILKFFQLLSLILVVFNVSDIDAQSKSKAEQDLVKRLFDNSQYDRRVRPIYSDGSAPVIVTVNMFLRSVSKLDEINNEVDVQLTYRQKWRDDRLTFRAGDVRNLNLINPENFIWRPDTFFSNEKEGSYHNLMVWNEFVRLSPNGEVLHSARISLKLSCPMNFRNFPFDRQTCPIRLASYGYTTSDVKYIWEADTPVQLMPNLNLPTHNLEGIVTVSCDSNTKTGNYSCLRADFTFKRLFTPFLVNVYIPCVMMFIVSYFSFWIDIKATTARMLLLVVTLLVLAISTAEINKTFPPTGYTKAVDVWTGTCLTFLFGALVEFIIVQYIARREEQRRNLSCSNSKINVEAGDEDPTQRGGDEEQEIPLKDVSPSNDDKDQPQGTGTVSKLKQRALDVIQNYVSNFDSLTEKIDGVSRVAFPAAFVIFIIFYWPVYSLSS